jgi:ComF family protein
MREQRSLFDTILGLLFPERCAGCLRLGELLCPTCRATVRAYPDDHYKVTALSGVQIGFVFDGPLREAIHQLKYQRRKRVARPLGALLTDRLLLRAFPAEALIPVPLHVSRQAERGFNQAEELAHGIIQRMPMPIITSGLTRIRATEQQAQLDARMRKQNTDGAFVWQGAEPPPKRALLVDDVLTTGATLSACATALRAAGAQEVYAIALARSLPPSESRDHGPGVRNALAS